MNVELNLSKNNWEMHCMAIDEKDLVFRLRKRAEIRRQIPSRKSVQEGKNDRIADLLEEAATYIERMRLEVEGCWQDAAGEDL